MQATSSSAPATTSKAAGNTSETVRPLPISHTQHEPHPSLQPRSNGAPTNWPRSLAVTHYFNGYGDRIRSWGGGPTSVRHNLSHLETASRPTAPSLARSLSVPAGTKSTGTVKTPAARAPRTITQATAASRGSSAAQGSKATVTTKAAAVGQPGKTGAAPKALPAPAPKPLVGADGKPLKKQPVPLRGADGKALRKQTAPAPLKGADGRPLKKTTSVRPSPAASKSRGSSVGMRKYSDAQAKNLYSGPQKKALTPNVSKVAVGKSAAKK
jgi:hypothetical protein